MSAAGRGVRGGGPDDVYITPSWAVLRLLEAGAVKPEDFLNGPWLEPAAGNGALIRAVNAWVTDNYILDIEWHAIECRATAKRELEATGAHVVIDDYLDTCPTYSCEVVFSNPPYQDAERFIRKARADNPLAKMFFLLRFGFLASNTRAALWSELGQPDVYGLPNRPSFTGSGTDSADYCWVVLPPDARNSGTFKMLATTPLAKRKAAR